MLLCFCSLLPPAPPDIWPTIAAAHRTLGIGLVFAAVGMPFVLGYTAVVY